MSDEPPDGKLQRPRRLSETPVPPIPTVDRSKPGEAATEFSHYRTKLSKHRTALSEHRTSLSEHRTDLSTHRTDLSTARTEMSKRRTGMSFQRTRMSADRTLMAVIRTSLALISFGFTIAEVFEKLREQGVLASVAPARNFGIALVALGILMLIGGIVYQVQFMHGVRAERNQMTAQRLIHGETTFPPSLTLFTAIILLLIGIAAIVSMVFDIGPFG